MNVSFVVFHNIFVIPRTEKPNFDLEIQNKRAYLHRPMVDPLAQGLREFLQTIFRVFASRYVHTNCQFSSYMYFIYKLKWEM